MFADCQIRCKYSHLRVLSSALTHDHTLTTTLLHVWGLSCTAMILLLLSVSLRVLRFPLGEPQLEGVDSAWPVNRNSAPDSLLRQSKQAPLVHDHQDAAWHLASRDASARKRPCLTQDCTYGGLRPVRRDSPQRSHGGMSARSTRVNHVEADGRPTIIGAI